MLLMGNIDAPMSYEFVDQMMEETRAGGRARRVPKRLESPRVGGCARRSPRRLTCTWWSSAAAKPSTRWLRAKSSATRSASSRAEWPPRSRTPPWPLRRRPSSRTRRFRRARSRRSTSSLASSARLTPRRSSGCAPRQRSCARAGGWCGPRPMCSRTARWWGSSPRRGSGSPSTRRRTSRLRGLRDERARPGGDGALRGRRERGPRAGLPRAAGPGAAPLHHRLRLRRGLRGRRAGSEDARAVHRGDAGRARPAAAARRLRPGRQPPGRQRGGDPRGAASGCRLCRVPQRLERAGDDEGRAGAPRRGVSFTLDLTEEQEALRAKTHAFARAEIRPAAPEYDRAQELPWPILQEAARQGLYKWELYAELSVDPTGLSLPILMEELFWGCAGIGLSIVMPALALAAIRQAATDEQLIQWAPECFGTPDDVKLAALAVTEPGGGSDIRSIQTRARKDGDDWVIDGQKVFIGNGGIADVHVVVATVDPEAGHRGQGVFVVPKGTPGLTMLRKLDKLRCRAAPPREIVFEACRVPAEHLMGGEERLQERIAKGREAEKGTPPPASTAEEGGTATAVQRRSSAALGAFERTRPMVAAQAIGIARAALEFARDYAVQREAFGQAIIENQGVSFPLADLAADIDAARLLTWRAAWMAAQRMPFEHAEGSMSKLKASEVCVRACEQAIQTLGGWGYIKDFPVEKWYRDAKLYTIFEGTSEIPRLLTGRALRAVASPEPLDQRMLEPR